MLWRSTALSTRSRCGSAAPPRRAPARRSLCRRELRGRRRQRTCAMAEPRLRPGSARRACAHARAPGRLARMLPACLGPAFLSKAHACAPPGLGPPGRRPDQAVWRQRCHRAGALPACVRRANLFLRTPAKAVSQHGTKVQARAGRSTSAQAGDALKLRKLRGRATGARGRRATPAR